MDDLGMRQAMTILTNRSCWMFPLMTRDTVYTYMVRICLSKITGRLLMTNPAE